ncbi:hypothetical protein TEA_024419 [Camellia sinensis var. sinensis]|uniref:Uncharacterized protein n=1 Tax=Camellia sinensis var. sinensis TaxID=542762 RepID=A0A4S4D123_CAMSN|nr:hypothetical protein TEA_024419 [Camellia sinensis var. sinensis]
MSENTGKQTTNQSEILGHPLRLPKNFNILTTQMRENRKARHNSLDGGHTVASFRQEARVSTQAYDKAADAAKQGANEAMNAGQDVKNKVASIAEDMTEKTKETAGTVAETAQDLTEKAKQRAGDAWDAVKDTTQKIKETVVGNGKAAAQETKQSVKQNAETVERSMNMKNE